MNWDAIGAIAESLGAIGVIASLIYLGVQLKSNAIASGVEAKLATTKLLTEFNDKFIHHPELYELWDKARTGSSELSDAEYALFTSLNMNSFWCISAGYYQKQAGKLPEGDWFEVESIMDIWMNNVGMKNWWSRHASERFSPDFVAYVNSRYNIESSA
jgi:hypothetical protein